MKKMKRIAAGAVVSMLTMLLFTFVMYTPVFAADGSSGFFGGVIKAFIFAIIAGLAIAFIITGIMLSKMKSVHMNNQAADYIRKNSMKVTTKRELYLYKNVDKRKINK